MKVIPNSTGWDIALDFSFTDRLIAERVAAYIETAIYALVRDAVSFCKIAPDGSPPSSERCERVPQ